MGYYTNFTLDCYDNCANSFDISFETDFGKALTAALHEINPGYFDDDFDLLFTLLTSLTHSSKLSRLAI